MQKVLAILEQYVEFIVLGLGALFLGLMAWWYLVQTPVTIAVGGQELRPGEIDAATAHGPVEVLDQKIQHTTLPKVTVPDFKKDLHERLVTPEPAPFPAVAFNVLPGDAVIKLPDKSGLPADQQIVKALPKIPAPEIADVNRGRTNVVMPPADWQPGQPLPVVNLQPILNPTPVAGAVVPSRAGAPAVPGHPGATVPGHPGHPGQPAPLVNPNAGRPAPAAVPAPAPVVPGQPAAPAPPVLADKDWVTVMYRLPMKAIGQAFTDVNIPQGQQLNLFKTCILDVELVRQEVVDGKPQGDETVVKKLEISGVPPFPNGLAEELQYVGWVSTNQNQIIQPGFFQIARGDLWMPPGVEPALAMNQPLLPANQTIDPNRKYTLEEIKAMTPQQRKQIRDMKEAQTRAKGKAAAPRTGGTGDMIPPDEMSPEVPDLSRMQFAQAAPPPDMEQNPSPEEMGMEGDQGMGFQQPQMAPAVFAQFPLPPAGEFDPRMAPDPTVGWAHDDTVEPGKSYRYKVRYKIKNPVFQIFNVAQPKNLSEVFAITSPDSGWSQPVSIPPLTRFFVASLFNNKVSLEIFRWQNGQLHSMKVNIAPGDMIAAKDPANGIDYTTGWTLVDITSDPGRENQPMIIVADPSGNLSRRDFKSDSNDPEYQKMKGLITAPVANAK